MQFNSKVFGTDDSESDSMRRLGIIDVGSNSVRLVVFDGAARSPAYFFNEKVLCGLGTSLAKTGCLDSEGRQRALRAIHRFALLAEGMKLSSLTAVATAAVREADDGLEFCQEVKSRTGVEIEVISGIEEAKLAAQGVFLGWPDAEGIVCDFGGSSTEIIEVSNQTIGRAITAKLGHLGINLNGSTKKQQKQIRNVITNIREQLNGQYSTLFLVGGSWRVIARLDMARNRYPLKVLNEYKMSCKSVLATVNWAAKLGHKKLHRKGLVSSDRLPGLLVSRLILKEMLTQFEPDEVGVSAYGIREGLLYKKMPQELRDRDPLIEACRHSEISSARLPGFGNKLFDFVKPLFKSSSEATLRLIQAACLLHDVTWRAHPAYRAEISFDNATRANLGGIDHEGRIFIALALYHRYRNSGSELNNNYTSLLCPKFARKAHILGKAMRFGSMFSATSLDKIGKMKFRAKKHVLILILPNAFQDIFGETVEARFNSLARAMDCEPIVEIV